MLHDFLTTNRASLIDRCRAMVARRSGPKLLTAELAHGIPILFDQIINALMVGKNRSWGGSNSDAGATAMLQGRDRLYQGFTLDQVTRDYGDVRQAVASLAVETGAQIEADEFRTFNRCLDVAIVAAANEYSRRKSAASEGPGALDKLQSAPTKSQTALAGAEAAFSQAQRAAHNPQARALHDPLTGLPNRQLFDDRLRQAISLAERHGWMLAVMFLDLDNFKTINDVHGHAAGDIVLKKVAEHLLHHVRDEDTVCRSGADEFLYLLVNPQGKANIERIANSVVRGIAQEVTSGDFQFVIRPSIGVAIYPRDGRNGEQLIANADTAMYRAKRSSRRLIVFHQRPADAVSMTSHS